MSQKFPTLQLAPATTKPTPRHSLTTRNALRLRINETQKHLYDTPHTQVLALRQSQPGSTQRFTRSKHQSAIAQIAAMQSNRQGAKMTPNQQEEYLTFLVQKAFFDYLNTQTDLFKEIALKLEAARGQTFQEYDRLSQLKSDNFYLQKKLIEMQNSKIYSSCQDVKTLLQSCNSDLIALLQEIGVCKKLSKLDEAEAVGKQIELMNQKIQTVQTAVHQLNNVIQGK